ncbi:nucleoside triphosphate hydrolase [Oricola sp.]|uniref:nucleoside triphosphate hydrolase n=1 Tax=Oricola sp. TaxID=1979950 RepID=UPI0025FD2FC1|nr:nucleoside triphosphate hydrolase [Oricola sp.]MCI5078576.1 nucleoside triphosphate hydrolase [Oricola sp.]
MVARDIEPSSLAEALIARAGAGRLIVALAGAPGSGKSTLAEDLVERINRADPGAAAILPMDGYHYDDGLLDELGRRARKGAPDTFDVGGFAHMLRRLRANEEDAVAVPVFDRAIEVARAGARMIARDIRIVVAEGNYLLLDEAPWSQLRPLFDVTVSIDATLDVLRDRLEARWRGFNLPPEVIATKVEGNDLVNARRVIEGSVEADFRIRT